MGYYKLVTFYIIFLVTKTCSLWYFLLTLWGFKGVGRCRGTIIIFSLWLTMESSNCVWVGGASWFCTNFNSFLLYLEDFNVVIKLFCLSNKTIMKQLNVIFFPFIMKYFDFCTYQMWLELRIRISLFENSKVKERRNSSLQFQWSGYCTYFDYWAQQIKWVDTYWNNKIKKHDDMETWQKQKEDLERKKKRGVA